MSLFLLGGYQNQKGKRNRGLFGLKQQQKRMGETKGKELHREKGQPWLDPPYTTQPSSRLQWTFANFFDQLCALQKMDQKGRITQQVSK